MIIRMIYIKGELGQMAVSMSADPIEQSRAHSNKCGLKEIGVCCVDG